MKSVLYKYIELFVIFILVPVSFVFSYSPFIKLAIGVMGFIYVLLKLERQKFKIALNLNWKSFWVQTLIKFLVIAALTTAFLWITDKENLFVVLRNKPRLWVFIIFIYSLFSVYPQELIYRTFFFNRYHQLFKSKNVLIFVNALLFALAHILFKNILVLILTFLGGILFALTFLKTKSTMLVSIEHAIYGCWLFTLGMGDLLGFPS